MSDRTSFYPELAKKIAPADGKLAVLLPGLGAVSTTLIAGVHLINKGLAQPIGSLHADAEACASASARQPRFVPIKELVPLAELDDLVFGGWDIFPDNAYEAAVKAGVLSKRDARPVRDRARGGQARCPPSSTARTSRTSTGPNVKKATTKMHLAEQLCEDIADFRKANGCRRAPSWSGAARPRSTSQPTPVHETIEAFEKGLKDNSPRHSALDDLRLRRDRERRALRQRRAEPLRRHPGAAWSSRASEGRARSPARTSRPARR